MTWAWRHLAERRTDSRLCVQTPLCPSLSDAIGTGRYPTGSCEPLYVRWRPSPARKRPTRTEGRGVRRTLRYHPCSSTSLSRQEYLHATGQGGYNNTYTLITLNMYMRWYTVYTRLRNVNIQDVRNTMTRRRSFP